MDTLTPAERSRVMSRIRGKDTKLELVVRRALLDAGWHYRLNVKSMIGKPDILIRKASAIIDIRGCFLHRHGCKDSTTPKSNIAFWREKFNRNMSRDRRNMERWRFYGWNVIVVWACAFEGKRREKTLKRIVSTIEKWRKERYDGTRRRPHTLTLPQGGESLERIIEDTRAEYRKLSEYKRTLTKEVMDIISKDDVSASDIDTFVEAANRILEDKGISPIKMSEITKQWIINNKGDL